MKNLLKKILDFKFKVPKLDLDSHVDFKNYYSLSFVIGTGILVSIIIFIAAVNVSQTRKDNQFIDSVRVTHNYVVAQLQNQELHFNIVKNLVLESRYPVENIPLSWLDKRIDETKFSCIYYVVWNNQNQSATVKNKGKEDPWCAKNKIHTKRVDSFKNLNDIEVASLFNETELRNYLVFTGFVSRVSRYEKAYLVAYLPFEYVSPSKFVNHIVDMSLLSIAETNESFENVELVKHFNENIIVRPLYLGGKKFKIEYLAKWVSRFPDELWPWAVLLFGFVITAIFSLLYFRLLVYSTQSGQKVKERTAELQKAMKMAQQANETKSKFLANVSHEVRTPLNLMLGVTDLLQESKVDPQQEEYIGSLRRSGQHLLDLINGVLDVARIEAGELVSSPLKISIPELFSEVARIVAVDCRRKKLNFAYNIDPGAPRYVKADPKLIRQVAINLLYNALKFTRYGEVSLNVECRVDKENEMGLLCFSIADTGYGIPKDQFDLIFKEFHKDKGERSDLGVGLGLSIVKTIVGHMKGKVNVDSIVGHGSTFSVEIPVEVLTPNSWLDRYAGTDSTLKNRRVFLYCHTELKQRFIKNCLSYIGCKVNVIVDGNRAIQELQQNWDNYDYIIIDMVNVPMGGLSVLEVCGTQGKDLKKLYMLCPLVHRADDDEKLKKMGITNVLFKPVDMDILINSLQRGVAQKDSAVTDKKEDSLPIKEQMSIIVAEDDVDNRNLIAHYLQNDNVNLYFAEDGAIALDKFKNAYQDFDLVLTDIQMPRMNGFQLTKNIRQFERERGLSNIPLVVVTADAQREQVEKLLQLGATEYITKPISKAKLRNTIVKHSVIGRKVPRSK